MKNSITLTALTFMLAAPGLMAQETTGTLLGTVKDTSGKPIAGATLRLKGDQLLGERTAVTSKDGAYRMPLLAAGPYTISVYAQGYSGQQAQLYLGAGSNIRQDLVMKPIQQAAATVEIVAVAAQVDKTETSTKTAFSTDQLAGLTGSPSVVGTSIAYNALALSPGVVGSVQYASIRGGSQQATNYLVNGISSRDNVTGQARLGDTVLDDSIEETAVIQSPLNAKYGGSSSGLVSVVTKRGSNEFTGAFRAKLSSQAWAALPIPFRNRYGTMTNPRGSYQADDLNRTWEITVSGPIIKDKLTFLWGTRITPTVNTTTAAFDPSAYGLDSVRFNGVNYPTNLYQANQLESAPQKMTYNQYELFYQINENHSLEANYTEAPQVNPDVQYSDVTPDASLPLVQTTMEKYESLSYRGIIGSNQVLTVRIGKNSSDTQFPSGPKSPVVLMAGPGGGDPNYAAMASLNDMFDATHNAYNSSPMAILGWPTAGAMADTQPDRRTTESFTANYNIILNWKGLHSIDVGVERQNPIWGTVSRGNSYPQVFAAPGQLSTNAAALDAVTAGMGANAGKYIVFPFGSTIDGITYNNLNDGYTPYLVPSMTKDYGANQSNVSNPTDSLYVNDLWSINDNWSVMAGLRYDRMRLMDATGTRSDSRMLSPRFDVKWDINGDQSRLVELSYGQFRGCFNARYYRTAVVSRLGNQATYYWNQGVGMQLVDYAAVTNPANYGMLGSFTSSDMYAIDHNWKPENDNEITLGYRRTYSEGGFWRATAIYRKWTDLTDVFPILGASPITITLESASQTSYTRLLTNDPKATRNYKGLEFEFMAPLGDHVRVGGNFTYSSLVGDNVYGDGTSFTSAQQTWAVQGDFRDRYEALGYSKNMFDPVGPLGQSRPVVLKGYISYQMASGRTKSSVALQGDFISGNRVSMTNQVSQDPKLIPFAMTDSNYPSQIPLYYNGRGQFSSTDTWHLNLTYNFDLALKNKVHFFSQMTIANLLNSQIPLSVSTVGSSSPRPLSAYANGYRVGTYSTYGSPTSGYSYVDGVRAINIDLGFKF